MKILLIYPLAREFLPPVMPPLGLAYIAAALEGAGHDVTIIDLNSERENGPEKLKTVLSCQQFGFVGISSIITQFKRVRDLGKLIKLYCPDTLLVMGGPGPTSIPELYLNHCFADIICFGEGEETIKDLARFIEFAEPLNHCEGLVLKGAGGKLLTNPQRAHIKDIDTISFPAWDKIDAMETYVKNYLFCHGRQRGMSLLSTRGCPGHCNYCMCNFGNSLRIRSMENIFEEIRMLIDKYHIEHIHFIDDTFIASHSRIIYLKKYFKANFPKLSWSANARADMVTPDKLNMMKDSGCISLAYGIESGSPTILKFIKKDVTVEQSSQAIQWTRQQGIAVTTYFMIGMPPETPQTIRESVDFCKENLVGGEFFFATPFPGTELYRYAREKKIVNNEVLYLEYVGEFRDFLVNLSLIDNEELFRLKDEAENEIKDHLSKHNITVRPSIRQDSRKIEASLPKF